MKVINPKIKGKRWKKKTNWKIKQEEKAIRIGRGLKRDRIKKKKANRVSKAMRKANRKNK